MNNTEHLLEVAKKKLKDFKISSLSFVKVADSEFLISASVDQLIEDLPNSIEIDGKDYNIDQNISKIQLLDDTELEFDGVTKDEGQRLQKWRAKVQGENNRGIIFENDCNAGDDGTEYPDTTVNKTRTRPLKCGLSISADKASQGTLGCFAIDNQDGKLVGLTNAHVLAERFLLTSEGDESGYKASVENTKVYQGDMSNLSGLTDDDAIGIVKRYFPVGLPYTTRSGGHSITKDQYQIDAALIAIKKGMINENSWKLAGIDNTSFNEGGAPTFASYNEHLNWVYDSFWGGYNSDVGGELDEFKTPQESDMLTSGAGTGPKDGTVSGDDNYRWRIVGPYKFQEQKFKNSKNPDATIIKFAANNVAIARQQNKDRYKSDQLNTIARGDWYCADNLIPGDSGSVLYAKIRGKWKMVGLIYATKFEHPTPETITYKEGLIIPFYLVAELLDISPWDGVISDDIFSQEKSGEIRTDLIYAKGKSNIYRHEVDHRLGKRAYFQAGSVERERNRQYTAVQESFGSGDGEIRPIQRNISEFITYDGIDIDLPTEGSFDKSNKEYQSNPVWFKVKNLNVPNSTIPANILDPGNGVITLDVAVIKEDSFEGLGENYFKKENRGKIIYASAPILEFYGSTINASGTNIDSLASKVSDLLGGADSNYQPGKQFTNLSKVRFDDGRKGSRISVPENGLNLNKVTGYIEHFPWELGADGKSKGGARATPEKLEDWIEEGSIKCLVLTYIDKDSEYIIDKVDLGAIETAELGTFPEQKNVAPTGDKIMRFDIDTSKYLSDLTVFTNGTNQNYDSYHWKNGNDRAAKTVMIPILEVGEGGATINWGDNTTTQVPANWKMKNQNQLATCWKNLKAGATTNTTHHQVHQDLGYDKIIHYYQTTGVKQITIEGDVLRFGLVGSFQDEAVSAGGTNYPASEKGWNANHARNIIGGLESSDFYEYSLMFSCRVTFINKFPNWQNCDFIYPFVLSNITGWNVNSEFAGFRSVGAFVTHIKKNSEYSEQEQGWVKGDWVSEGFSDFTNGNIGPFDNWKFGENYSEDFDFFERVQYKEGEDGFGVKQVMPYESLYHTFYPIIRNGNIAIKGTNTIWPYYSTLTDKKWEGLAEPKVLNTDSPYSEVIGNIRFNHDLKIGVLETNPASINQEPFYNYICNQVNNSSKQVSVKHLKLENYKSFNRSDEINSGVPSKSYDWMSRTNVVFIDDGSIDFASGTLPKYSIIAKLLAKNYELSSSEGIDSIENIFESARINFASLSAFMNRFTLKGSCSYKRAFKNATFTTSIDFSKFSFSGNDLTEMFKSATFKAGNVNFSKIETPSSIKGWFEDAVISNGTIKGLAGLRTSESTDIRNAFLNLKIQSDITDLPRLKLSEGQTFDLITSKCESLRDELGNVNPSAFRVATDSAGSITLPENLNFVNEIVDYVRMTPGTVSNTTEASILENEYSVAINKGYPDASRIGWEDNQIKPSFVKAGKYAILVDSARGTPYSANSSVYESDENNWASVYNSNLDLGLYQSESGYWTKSDRRLIGGKQFFGNNADDSEEVTDTKYIKKFKAMALSSNEYYWMGGNPVVGTYNKNVLSNLFSCRTLFESIGRHSYWAIITVDKDEYQKQDLHLRFKNTTFTSKDWAEVSVEPFSYAHNMLHAAEWNGGSISSPRSLLSNQKGKFWTDAEELLGQGGLATLDSDSDGILDIDEKGDDITDPDTKDSKITITYADSAEYNAIASVDHDDLGYLPQGHEIASNKVGISLQIGTGGITIDWGDDNDPVAYTTSNSGVIVKDYESSGGEKTIIIDGDVTTFGSDNNHGVAGHYLYGYHTTSSETDKNVRIFLGSQFRMKSFKYEGGGGLLKFGRPFGIGNGVVNSQQTHKGKTMFDPTNNWAAENTGLPKSNCQVSVDLSGFKPYSINNISGVFSQLYTHDLDLSSLDFSRIVSMDELFACAIITGNLKMPKVDDSNPAMPDSRYFNERQNTFDASRGSPATRKQALKDAHRRGGYKRLNWSGPPLKALEDDEGSGEGFILENISNCYRQYSRLFVGAVINEITFGNFKPIFTKAEDYGFILGRGSNYINKIDGAIAEQFPKSSMGRGGKGLLLAPQTKEINMTASFVSKGKQYNEENAWTGPYDREITYELSLGKDDNTGNQHIDVVAEQGISEPMTTEGEIFDTSVILRLKKNSGFEPDSVNNLREARARFKVVDGDDPIKVGDYSFNSTFGYQQIEYEMPKTTTVQGLVNFINSEGKLAATVLSGNTSQVVSASAESSQMSFYGHKLLELDFTGVTGGITVSEIYSAGYLTLNLSIGNGNTRQDMIDAINQDSSINSKYTASAKSYHNNDDLNNVINVGSPTMNRNSFSQNSKTLLTKGGIDHASLGWSNFGEWRHRNTYIENPYNASSINVYPDNTYVFDWSDTNIPIKFSLTDGGTEWNDPDGVITVNTTQKKTTLNINSKFPSHVNGTSNFPQTEAVLYGYAEGKSLFSMRINYVNNRGFVLKGKNSWENFGYSSKPSLYPFNGYSDISEDNWTEVSTLPLMAGLKYIIDYSELHEASIYDKLDLLGDNISAGTHIQVFNYFTSHTDNRELIIDLTDMTIDNYTSPFDWGNYSQPVFVNGIEWNQAGLTIGSKKYNQEKNTASSNVCHVKFNRGPVADDNILPNNKLVYAQKDTWFYGIFENHQRYSTIKNRGDIEQWMQPGSYKDLNLLTTEFEYKKYETTVSSLFAGKDEVYKYNDDGTITTQSASKVSDTWGRQFGDDSYEWKRNTDLITDINPAEAKYRNSQCGCIDSMLNLKTFKYTQLTNFDDWAEKYPEKAPS
ncbi:MAG: hypothetical protein P8P37_02315 [Candidatus Marinimicrobia bacterium]|nr:hypothetical protein [Candidatus Neomarinimicrobiota bacterium]